MQIRIPPPRINEQNTKRCEKRDDTRRAVRPGLSVAYLLGGLSCVGRQYCSTPVYRMAYVGRRPRPVRPPKFLHATAEVVKELQDPAGSETHR